MTAMWRRAAAARVALVYGAVATLWILWSDRAALALFGDAVRLTWVQTLKGLGFVAASAVLIYVLVRRERRRWLAAEAAERQAARRFEAIFRASPAGILIADLPERRYLDANDRFLEMFGYGRDEVVGRTIDEVDFWSDPRERRAHLGDLREHGALRERSGLFRRADGALRTMVWSAELLELGGRDRLITALADLTDRTEAYEQTLVGWARALDLRDHETAGHALRVTALAEALGRRLDLPASELVSLRWGALLHDIGKIGVPDGILNKPGPLDEEEWAIMRGHPTVARELLEPIEFLDRAIEIPAWHHERWDGSGYPDGLAGEDTPLSARVFAVVDVWDALISDRPYRKAWTRDAALAHIREEAGRLFDPQVVAAFEAMVADGEA
ncbi:MAG: HD domain-containing protein [Deinococcus-Thermus bacterium]|nr:HD domain-containing protein [Deinococcota bacterium]